MEHHDLVSIVHGILQDAIQHPQMVSTNICLDESVL
jgi:hypothetical protein